MAFSVLNRKPDSGLGNVRSSPGDPSRNVDWILLLGQSILIVIGCLTVYSASRTKGVDQPYEFLFAQRQVVFVIIGALLTLVDLSAREYLEKGQIARFLCVFLPGLSLVQIGGSFPEMTATAGASWLLAFGLSHIRPWGRTQFQQQPDEQEPASDDDEEVEKFSERDRRPRATSV